MFWVPTSPLYTCDNAANSTLPVLFINHSDCDVVPKHSYVRTMEKVGEFDRGTLTTNTSPKPVS